MSADFWGLKTAGGTATAYHLLAAMLAKSHALEVRLLHAIPVHRPCLRCHNRQEGPGQDSGLGSQTFSTHLLNLDSAPNDFAFLNFKIEESDLPPAVSESAHVLRHE